MRYLLVSFFLNEKFYKIPMYNKKTKRDVDKNISVAAVAAKKTFFFRGIFVAT